MINENIIRSWWHVFKNDSELVEIRILGKFTYSGYYKNIDKLIADIKPYEELHDEQIYFTLNDINEGCYGRQQCESIVKGPKQTTSDTDITHRKFVMIDFDPVRTIGVNATDAEFELAHKKAQQVFLYLRSIGFNDPVICRSGNGWHLHYRCDLPNSQEVIDTLKDFFSALAMLFTDESVDIDQKVFNASRVCKLYGTTAKKGANIPERPWRPSSIEYVPSEVKVNGYDLFQKVASLLPKQEPKPISTYSGGYYQNDKFDVESFLSEHGVGFKKVAIAGGTKYVLDHCIFDENHKAPDAAVFQRDSGEIGYTCFHNHCSHYTWRDARLRLDPHAYDPKPDHTLQPYQKQKVFQHQNTPQPSIKPEIPELGKKWFSMKNIPKVNIHELEGFKSGFTDLDRAIKRMFFSSLTIVSGSNASGKSSWLNSLLLNAIQQGFPCALWSGELRPDVLKTWIQMVAAGKECLRHSSNGQYWFVPNDVSAKIDEWTEGKFYLYNNEYSNKWEQIFSDMKELLNAGVRIFILDNLFSLDIDIFGGDSNQKQKELINQITDFKKKYKAHIILVAHPRKTVSFIRKNDISGTSAIIDAADYIFIIHRVNQDFRNTVKVVFPNIVLRRDDKSPEFNNMIEVSKDRMMGTQDYFCGMYYEPESRRFKNTYDEKVVYGWRDDVGKQITMFDEEASMPQTASDDIPFPPAQDSETPF